MDVCHLQTEVSHISMAPDTFIKVRISETEKILVVCNAICDVVRRRDEWSMANLHDS
jgi:hypothetical protein